MQNMPPLSAIINSIIHPVGCIFGGILFAIVPSMRTDAIIDSKKMGERIKFRRQDIGMSQERLAEILDVSYQQIQRYESGRNRLNVENIQVIASALDVPITFFFDPSSTTEFSSLTDSTEEKTLLKHFRQIEHNPDRQVVILVARRLASKR